MTILCIFGIARLWYVHEVSFERGCYDTSCKDAYTGEGRMNCGI